MFALFRKADAYLAAHPQLITAALTAAAAFLARYGFNVSSTVVAAVATIVVAFLGAWANGAVKRKAARDARRARAASNPRLSQIV